MFVLRVSCVQVTPIGVTTLYSTFSFFRRKKLLHQVGGTKVAQHGQTRYAHLMEILMWKKYHFQLYTRYGQLCRYYWWHIVCTILSLPAAGAGLRLASSLPDPVPGHSLSPSSGAEAAAASTPCLGRTPCLDSGTTPGDFNNYISTLVHVSHVPWPGVATCSYVLYSQSRV